MFNTCFGEVFNMFNTSRGKVFNISTEPLCCSTPLFNTSTALTDWGSAGPRSPLSARADPMSKWLTQRPNTKTYLSRRPRLIILALNPPPRPPRLLSRNSASAESHPVPARRALGTLRCHAK